MKAIVSETAKVCPQFYDLDPMNIVWHGNYPRFFELARTALLAKIGYGYDAMLASGFAWPVIDMHIRYYRPLRLARWVDVTASITEWEKPPEDRISRARRAERRTHHQRPYRAGRRGRENGIHAVADASDPKGKARALFVILSDAGICFCLISFDTRTSLELGMGRSENMKMTTDVVVIGAGPSGSVAAAYLAARGYAVEVLERVHFPRFSIGESLLPQSMELLEEAALLDCVVAGKFQFKDGAVFRRGDEEQALDFREKSAPGWGTTFQVKRDLFDQILAQGAAAKGARVTFGEEVTQFVPGDDGVTLHVRSENGDEREIAARFALDGSGFGRVLARLLSLDKPSDFPVRKALFCHVLDKIEDRTFDRTRSSSASIPPTLPSGIG